MSRFEQRREALRKALAATDQQRIIDIGVALTERGFAHLTPRRPNGPNPSNSHYPEATPPWPEFGNRGPDFDQWNKWYQYDWNYRPGDGTSKPDPV